MAVTTDDVMTAYERVLSLAGAFPRDVVTIRTFSEVEGRTGSWGAKPPADLFEGLTAQAPETDSDGDGMPDTWESAHGLDPNDEGDASDTTSSGYTAIEDYIHERAAVLMGETPSAGTGGSGGGSSGSGGSTSPATAGFDGEDGSGCACGTASGNGVGHWYWAGLLGAWIARRRRKQRPDFPA